MPSSSASCPALAALDIAEDATGGTAGSGIAVAFLSNQRWDDAAFQDLSPCLLQAMARLPFKTTSLAQSLATEVTELNKNLDQVDIFFT